jgi:hypothetical protein
MRSQELQEMKSELKKIYKKSESSDSGFQRFDEWSIMGMSHGHLW